MIDVSDEVDNQRLLDRPERPHVLLVGRRGVSFEGRGYELLESVV